MPEHSPIYYEECNECKFAVFHDYENMECTLSVGYNPHINCPKFQAIGGKNYEIINIFDNSNQTIDLSYEKALENQRPEEITKERIELIKNTEPERSIDHKVSMKSEITYIGYEKYDYKRDRKLDNRLLTLSEVDIYTRSDIRLGRKIRTELPNKLIPFKREIIRNGFDLFMLKESNGQKAYIWKEPEKVKICNQCLVKENPLDIILMPHKQFDAYAESTKPEVKELKKADVDEVESFIQTRYGTTVVCIKDMVKQDKKTVSYVNIIGFGGELSNVKIGRLAPYTKFYITSMEGKKSVQRNITGFYIISPEGNKRARKIMTDDGTEAILISNADTYIEIVHPLQKLVLAIIVLLTQVIYYGGTVILFTEKGWLITGSLLAVIIGCLVSFFVGAPIYYLLNQIVKRL